LTTLNFTSLFPTFSDTTSRCRWPVSARPGSVADCGLELCFADFSAPVVVVVVVDRFDCSAGFGFVCFAAADCYSALVVVVAVAGCGFAEPVCSDSGCSAVDYSGFSVAVSGCNLCFADRFRCSVGSGFFAAAVGDCGLAIRFVGFAADGSELHSDFVGFFDYGLASHFVAPVGSVFADIELDAVVAAAVGYGFATDRFCHFADFDLVYFAAVAVELLVGCGLAICFADSVVVVAVGFDFVFVARLSFCYAAVERFCYSAGFPGFDGFAAAVGYDSVIDHVGSELD
jgi:hypothetical protein